MAHQYLYTGYLCRHFAPRYSIVNLPHACQSWNHDPHNPMNPTLLKTNRAIWTFQGRGRICGNRKAIRCECTLSQNRVPALLSVLRSQPPKNAFYLSNTKWIMDLHINCAFHKKFAFFDCALGHKMNSQTYSGPINLTLTCRLFFN